jgi:hypothetical protein
MPNDRLAQVAYAAYASVINHPLDEWDELNPEDKDAWRHAADAVVMGIGTQSGIIQSDTDPA